MLTQLEEDTRKHNVASGICEGISVGDRRYGASSSLNNECDDIGRHKNFEVCDVCGSTDYLRR